MLNIQCWQGWGKLSVGRSVTFPVFLKALLQGHPDTPLCKKSRLGDDWLFLKEQPAFMHICGYYLTTSSNNYLAPLVFPTQLQLNSVFALTVPQTVTVKGHSPGPEG